MSDTQSRVTRARCGCCGKRADVCARAFLCAACVRYANASFAIANREAELKKAREEFGKPPKGPA